MDRLRLFDELLCGQSFCTAAIRAAGYLVNMVSRHLKERAVVRTDNRNLSMGVDVVNARVVVAITMYVFGFFDESSSC